jgi:hypothetical protein
MSSKNIFCLIILLFYALTIYWSCFISGNTLLCTLWDALSVKFMDAYNNRIETGPFVIILKHARVKEPQGKCVILNCLFKYNTIILDSPTSTFVWNMNVTQMLVIHANFRDLPITIHKCLEWN